MVDLEGPQRGRTVGDPTLINSPAEHVRMALGVDAERFVPEWYARVLSACERMNVVIE